MISLKGTLRTEVELKSLESVMWNTSLCSKIKFMTLLPLHSLRWWYDSVLFQLIYNLHILKKCKQTAEISWLFSWNLKIWTCQLNKSCIIWHQTAQNSLKLEFDFKCAWAKICHILIKCSCGFVWLLELYKLDRIWILAKFWIVKDIDNKYYIDHFVYKDTFLKL